MEKSCCPPPNFSRCQHSGEGERRIAIASAMASLRAALSVRMRMSSASEIMRRSLHAAETASTSSTFKDDGEKKPSARSHRVSDRALDELLFQTKGGQSLSGRARSLQEVGMVVPQNRMDKRAAREALRRAIECDTGTGKRKKEEYAGLLRWTLGWRDLRSVARAEVVRGFFARLEGDRHDQTEPLNAAIVAYVVSFLSTKGGALLGDQEIRKLARYVYEHGCLSDVVAGAEALEREISPSALQTVCERYADLVLASGDRSGAGLPAAVNIADLLHGASTGSGQGLASESAGELVRAFSQFRGEGCGTRELSRVVGSIEAFDLDARVEAEALVGDFLGLLRAAGGAGAPGDEIARVLRAIASLSLPYKYDDVEFLIGGLRVAQIPPRELLSTLQAIRKLNWKFGHQVIEDVFGAFAAKVKQTRRAGEVPEMLSTMAEMGYNPLKIPLQRGRRSVPDQPEKQKWERRQEL